MFIELVSSLRCPGAHQDSWLVASISRFDGRHIVDGTLGCPICLQQFPVWNGVVDFTAANDDATNDDATNDDALSVDIARGHGTPPDDEIVRAAALLGLDDDGGVVLLAGKWGRLAAALESLASAHALLLNPGPRVGLGAGCSAIQSFQGVPLAGGSIRAALMDEANAWPARLNDVVRALMPGGRLVAPASMPLPAGVRELARDTRQWVAVVEESTSAPIPLRRA